MSLPEANLINTGLQPGGRERLLMLEPFQRFGIKTVETVVVKSDSRESPH